MKLPLKGLIAIALVLSLGTSMLVYNYLKGTKTGPKGTVPVVVAKVDIPAKTRITPDMIQEKMVPAEYVQPGTVTVAKSIVGAIVREKIVANEQITERRLLIEGKTGGFVGLIPANKRAVTVAVTEVTGVAGFVKAGDMVDVVAVFDKGDTGQHAGSILIQNAQVLAVNRETEMVDTPEGAAKDKKEAVKSSTVTLAVDPEEAAKLALAEEKGKIRLVLRPFLPDNDFVIAQTSTPTGLVGFHPQPGANKGKENAGNSQTPEKVVVQMQAQGPFGSSPASQSQPVFTNGITVLRGTKAEVVPVN